MLSGEIYFGGNADETFEFLSEMALVVKTAGVGDIGNRQTPQEQLFGVRQAQVCLVKVRRNSGPAAKHAAQMKLARA